MLTIDAVDEPASWPELVAGVGCATTMTNRGRVTGVDVDYSPNVVESINLDSFLHTHKRKNIPFGYKKMSFRYKKISSNPTHIILAFDVSLLSSLTGVME